MRETKNACHPKGRQARPDVVPPYFRRPARAVTALRVPDNGGYRIRLMTLWAFAGQLTGGFLRAGYGWGLQPVAPPLWTSVARVLVPLNAVALYCGPSGPRLERKNRQEILTGVWWAVLDSN